LYRSPLSLPWLQKAEFFLHFRYSNACGDSGS
jgi:hypothetical protein